MEDERSLALEVFKNDFSIKTKSVASSKGGKSKLTDGQLENNLRTILEKKFDLSKIDKKELSDNKEFRFYCLELFDKEKKLIRSKNFEEDETFYYIKEDEEYFFIKADDFSKLYYSNNKKNENKIIKGFKEDQIRTSEYTKFYITEDKPEEKNSDNSVKNKYKMNNKNEEEELSREFQDTFIDDIKFNLISDKTFNVYGKNNNISEDYFQGYCSKGKLLSKGNRPYILGFGEEKDINSIE